MFIDDHGNVVDIPDSARDVYTNIVNSLYKGQITTDSGAITHDTVDYVNKLINEVEHCHRELAPFAALFETIVDNFYDEVPDELKVVFGTMSAEEYFASKGFGGFFEDLQQKANVLHYPKILDFVINLLESWLDYVMSDEKFDVCINQLRNKYRMDIYDSVN